jgi:hypothetical protein
MRLLGESIQHPDPMKWSMLERVVGLSTAARQSTELGQEVYEGMLACVLAHELGHLCLGHTVRSERVEPETSRAHEREADDFSSRVLSGMQSRAQMFVGQAMLQLLMAWRDRKLSVGPRASHPASCERYLATLSAQQAALREAEQRFGISEDDWRGMLPPTGMTGLR